MRIQLILPTLWLALSILILLSCKTNKPVQQPAASIATGESFEGRIIYDLEMIDKTGDLNAREMRSAFGEEQVYTIKGDHYKSEFSGIMKITQYYLGQDTLYNHFRGVSNLVWLDAASNPDTIIRYDKEENADLINGIMCHKLTIYSNEGKTEYFYNANYVPARPETFIRHEYGFWKFCVEQTHSLPLKQVSDTRDLKVTITAQVIQPEIVDDQEFTLPDLPRVKSPDR